MSAPRRIPTEEIEVGRWYRVEDAVPADRSLLVLEWQRDSVETYSANMLEPKESAWMYPGPIPSELPPREEKPKRFTSRLVFNNAYGVYGIYDGNKYLFEIAGKDRADHYVRVLNAGHEALEGGES